MEESTLAAGVRALERRAHELMTWVPVDAVAGCAALVSTVGWMRVQLRWHAPVQSGAAQLAVMDCCWWKLLLVVVDEEAAGVGVVAARGAAHLLR